MSDQRDLSGDVNRVVRSWLREDRHEDADRVLGAVLDELDATPQRRAGWPARRTPTMNKFFALGLTAAAVVVAMFIGIQFFGGSNVGGPGPAETPVPTPTPIALADAQSPLDPNSRYQVNAGPGLDVTVAIQSGWSGSGDWVVVGPRDNQAPDGMAVRFYSGDLNLYVDPLDPNGGELTPPVGPAVADLVNAIVNNPAWGAGTPTDITIDGHPGQLVSLTIPSDAPLTGSQEFTLFVDPSGGSVWGWAPSQTFDLYILDVDGERLVIDAFHYPGTSDADLAAQRTVVESVQASAIP